ncbi:MAG TPA: DMT family transporter [Rhizobiaceae bacterium]|nr:DMT family transporter [Rhizobiaceae bacterium]
MHRNAYVLLLLTALFWGGNAVAGKLAVGHISPAVLTLARWGFATAILLAMGWPRLKADWPAIRPKLGLLIALGVCGFTLFNIALYTAVLYTSAVNVSIEQAGIPMVIFLLNFVLYRLKAAPGQIIGFSLSLIGIALTAAHGEVARLVALDVNFGDALMLIAVLVYAGYTVALRGKPNIHWQSLMIMLCGSAAVATIPFTVWEHARAAMILPDMRGWAIIAYTALFPSILSQIFYIRGVEMIGANRAGIFVNLVPVFGTLLSIVLLGEAFHAYHAVAMALVFGGIWLAETSARRAAS